MPYTYTKYELHQALLNTGKGFDGLHYMFYAFDLNFWRDNHGGDSLPHIVSTLNKAGFHVHAFSYVAGGVDLWVERMYRDNRWGDQEVNREYVQQERPLFEEDVPNEI